MKFIKRALAKYQGLSIREQLLVVLTAIVVLYVLVDLALLSPQRAQRAALARKIAQQEVDQAALTKVIAQLSAGGRVNLLAKELAERNELRSKAEAASAVMGEAAGSVRLGELIRAMTAGNQGVTLVALKTLPAEVFYKASPMPEPAASGAAPGAQAVTLYKQGVEVTVKGNFLALVRYLQNLQRDPNRIFWGSARLDVMAYPDATLKMTVHTLSPRSDSPLN